MKFGKKGGLVSGEIDIVVFEDDGEPEPGPNPYVDEVDPVDRILDEVRELNFRKRADYAEDADPFSNFRDIAFQLGLTPGHAVEAHVATKQSRLRQLLFTGREVSNEGVRDTLVDRAVYALIAVALYDEGAYSTNRTDKGCSCGDGAACSSCQG